MARKIAVPVAADEGEAGQVDESLIDNSTDKSLTLEMMAEYVAKCPNKDQIFSYLFRAWPKIQQRRITGPKGLLNIDKLAGVYTRDQILSKYGSGVYKISFHDFSRPRAKRRVGQYVLELHEPGVLPVCDARTVVWEEAENQSYISQLQAAGALPQQAFEYIARRDGLAASGVPVAAAAAPAVPSLSAQVSEVISTARMLREEMGGGSKGGGDALQGSILLPLITTLGNMNMQLFERMNQVAAGPPPAAAPAGSAIGQIKEVVGLMQLMGWRSPGGAVVDVAADAAGGGVEGAAPTGSVIMAGLSSVSSIVRDVRDMLAMFRGGGVAGVAPAAPGAAPVDEGGEYVDNGPPGGDVVPMPERKGESMLQQLQAFGQLALDAFFAGETGPEFAARMATIPANLAALDKARSFGTARIGFYLEMVDGLPAELSKRGRTMAELEQWIIAAVAVPAVAGGGRKKAGRA